MSDVIDSGDVAEPDPLVSDDSVTSDSYGNANDDLSIFEIDGDYNPDETDGKVH